MTEIQTAERIKLAAKKIFFYEGRIQARMQEIADSAGINRAMLHYYFRDREHLFEVVLKEALEDSFIAMFRILSAKKTFETKVREAVYHIADKLAEYPFIETFIISEINQQDKNKSQPAVIKAGKKFSKLFLKEIAAYQNKKGKKNLVPEDFLVNMMALCAYPSSTKPIVKSVLGLNEKSYEQFLTARKERIVRILLS